jgi:hypothetical protein
MNSRNFDAPVSLCFWFYLNFIPTKTALWMEFASIEYPK